MKNKHKKDLLFFIFFIATCFAILSMFSPVMRYSLSDELKERGLPPLDNMDWTSEQYYLFDKFAKYRYDFPGFTGKTFVQQRIWIFHGYCYEFDNYPYELISDYYDEEEGVPSTILTKTMFVPFGIIFFLFSFYYFFIYLKNFSKGYSKLLLYTSIFYLFSLITFVIGNFISWYQIKGLHDRIPYLKFGYGFYYSIIAIILFFIAFYLQRYVYEIPKEEKNFLNKF